MFRSALLCAMAATAAAFAPMNGVLPRASTRGIAPSPVSIRGRGSTPRRQRRTSRAAWRGAGSARLAVPEAVSGSRAFGALQYFFVGHRATEAVLADVSRWGLQCVHSESPLSIGGIRDPCGRSPRLMLISR
jgi:hypothetical protein